MWLDSLNDIKNSIVRVNPITQNNPIAFTRVSTDWKLVDSGDAQENWMQLTLPELFWQRDINHYNQMQLWTQELQLLSKKKLLILRNFCSLSCVAQVHSMLGVCTPHAPLPEIFPSMVSIGLPLAPPRVMCISTGIRGATDSHPLSSFLPIPLIEE